MNVIFFYSIAGRTKSDAIDSCLESFVHLSCVSPQDKKVAEHCITCAANGNYPSEEYFANIYPQKPTTIYKTEAEIVTHYKLMVDFFMRQYALRQLTQAGNETTTYSDLLTRVNKIMEDAETLNEDDFEFKEYAAELYGDVEDKPLEQGMLMGVEEIDKTTHGFQRGTVASICGFTGHGKSTACNSSVYLNIMQGKKALIISLELAPELLWKQFETRYMFDAKGMNVSLDQFLYHTLDKDKTELVKLNEDDMRKELLPNLLIIDENKINKKMMQDYRKINKLLKSAEHFLGGLDMVVLDHVGQLELLYPECGNMILKQLTSAAKTYKNDKGEKISMVWAVQCNREGNKRAIRRDGQYDLQAIADLNEVERSSTYCVFLYTSDGMKITQETKVSLLKNRLGVPIPQPFVTSFTPSVVSVGKKVEHMDLDSSDFSFTQMNDDFEDLPPF